MMKILVTSSIFPPEIGGPATYAREFSKRATKLGHEVRVITLTDSEAETLERVWIKGLKRSRNKLARQSSLLLNIVRAARGCDVIYAQNPAAIGLPSVLAAKFLGKPVVVKYVGDTAWEKAFREGKTERFLEDFLENPDANENILRVERFVFKRATKIITPSKFLSNILVKYHRVPEGKIDVIPNAVDAGGVKLPKKKENAIITVARLVPWKGVQDIISLMPKIRKETGAELWIVGDGPHRSELERLAKPLDGIRFLGALSHKKTLDTIASSRVFVLNSLYEGMPHVLLEAMALKTAIVATDICGNPELIRDNENGLLVPPKDSEALKKAIYRLLADDGLAKRLSESAEKDSSKYSWPNILSKTLSSLEEVAKR